MLALIGYWNRLAFILFALLALAAPVRAQPTLEPWQEVITGQIQAFRDHDAPAALSYAAKGFQTAFPSSEAFFVSIIGSGYAPIMESISHNFSEFKMVGDKSVAQQVLFVGPNQEVYHAVYLLTEEEAGWRVQGVQLVATKAVGI